MYSNVNADFNDCILNVYYMQALDVIEESLKDENIRKGHRFALFQRAQKICSTASNKLKLRWSAFECDIMNCVQQPREVIERIYHQDVVPT